MSLRKRKISGADKAAYFRPAFHFDAYHWFECNLATTGLISSQEPCCPMFDFTREIPSAPSTGALQ